MAQLTLVLLGLLDEGNLVQAEVELQSQGFAPDAQLVRVVTQWLRPAWIVLVLPPRPVRAERPDDEGHVFQQLDKILITGPVSAFASEVPDGFLPKLLLFRKGKV